VIAADIASFPLSPHGPQGPVREAAGLGESCAVRRIARCKDNRMRRNCVAVIQRICVITAKVTLTNDIVTECRKVLGSLIVRRALFLEDCGVIIPTHGSTVDAMTSFSAPYTSTTTTSSLPPQCPSTRSLVSSSSIPRGSLVEDLLIQYRAHWSYQEQGGRNLQTEKSEFYSDIQCKGGHARDSRTLQLASAASTLLASIFSVL
jgi:hypothetical protein